MGFALKFNESISVVDAAMRRVSGKNHNIVVYSVRCEAANVKQMMLGQLLKDQ